MDPSPPLASFASVPRWLQATGRAFSLAPGAQLLQCRYEHPRGSAIVAMRRLLSRSGAEWLALSVPICTADRIRPRAALVAGDALPVGALALREGVVFLRQTLPLQSLAAAQLEHLLGELVDAAAQLAVAAAEPGRDLPYRWLFR